MRKYEYSNELAEAVKTFLVDDDWHFSFDEDTGRFKFGLRTKGKMRKLDYVLNVHNDEIVVYGMCTFDAESSDENMMAQMAEFICRANYGLKNGCFEFDFRDGEIRYKSFIDCENLIPSAEVIKNSIYCIASMYQRYTPGIFDICFLGGTAKEAIAKCEKSIEDEVRSLLTGAVGEDMGEDEINEVIASLTVEQEGGEDA
ncbi:YbjN domain-containing protein [Lachnospiraceae bacterium 210521-DFI.5.20]|uniref:YbjN domain-containing protein n=1 Tax=Fusicatenibacter saccharivorans TaxID=1150298 RepID=A0AAE3F0C2_9FIRM|nr:YbjN domain-containing protein [Fusicatenibacter saccharivorans]MCB6301698.1 YbjN domain-containing protein [Lachnospiraceae bacterium 210521-DFI.5.20]MCG4765152.1 YbjN domain-containing protein [Fusicatenibacter saccharivorans]